MLPHKSLTMDVLFETGMEQAIKNLLASSVAVDVAVAFWGEGAQRLVASFKGRKLRLLCNLVCGGTNPSVLQAIRARLGKRLELKHSRTLHAKVWLANNHAILGSSNVSANGLALQGREVKGWTEVNIRITQAPTLNRLRGWFQQQWGNASAITDEDWTVAERRWLEHRGPGPMRKSVSLGELVKLGPDHTEGLYRTRSPGQKRLQTGTRPMRDARRAP